MHVVYEHTQLSLYIFNNISNTLKLRKQIIKYHKKKLNILNTIEKFGLRFKSLSKILNFTKEQDSKSYKTKKIKILLMFFKLYILRVLYKSLLKLRSFSILKLRQNFKFIRSLQQPYIHLSNTLRVNKKYISLVKKLNCQTVLKAFSIKLENIIF